MIFKQLAQLWPTCTGYIEPWILGSIYSLLLGKARIAAKNFALSEFLNVQIFRNRRIKNWHELCTVGISNYEISSRAVIGVSPHN